MNSRQILTAIVAVIGLMTGFDAVGQETRKLSLSEAIQLSLQNSNQLKLQQAKVTEATAALREAKERRLPDLSITGSYMRLNKPTLDLKTQSPQQGEGGGSTGGNSLSSIEVKQVGYGMANLSLPVFAGFRIQNGIDAAKYLEKAAKLDAQKDRADVIENTIAAYSNLYKAKEALDLVKENLKQSQQRVADFSNLEKNGLLARNDLLKAQLQQSNVELALLDAENAWKLTNISMNLMLGLAENTDLVPDGAEFKSPNEVDGYTTWESKAMENRADIAASEMRIKAANSGVKAAKGEYYPSLALTGGYIGANIPDVLTLTNALNAGVGVKYSPSSLWKTGSKVAQAKAQLQQVKMGQNLLTDNVRLQTAQAYQNFLSSKKKIEVYAKAVEQATENYRIVKNKHTNNLATTTDLLDADVAQLQARLNQAVAEAEAMVSYNKLLQTAGVLTPEITNK
ncbi:TolC family protein [Polluticoccus soli]|uniref:TolC family protein n=1 Tax=Polluticoccus soli TaxID=3034150 RepID=UPI0023E3458F|nr:TolC family protein [Flavipsychrobacter sp. JY13-12]